MLKITFWFFIHNEILTTVLENTHGITHDIDKEKPKTQNKPKQINHKKTQFTVSNLRF